MRPMLRSRIHGVAVPEIEAAGKAGLDQQVEGAVNGSQVDRPRALAHLGEDLFGGDVTGAISQSFDDHFTLRRDPVAALAQGLDVDMAVRHCEGSLLRILAIRLYQILSDLGNKKERPIAAPRRETRAEIVLDMRGEFRRQAVFRLVAGAALPL